MSGLLDVLTRIPMFVGLRREQMAIVMHYFKLKTFEPGEFFFRENDPADALFFIVEGSVRILKGVTSGGMLPVAKVGAGNFIGELAILDSSFRSASVQSITKVMTISISTADYDAICNADRELGFMLMKSVARVISEQLRKTTQNLANTQKRLDE